MLRHASDNSAATPPAPAPDPYEARRDALRKLPVNSRIIAIRSDLKNVSPLATTDATFHRKKLLRMLDAARLQAGKVTTAELNRENSFTLDFRKAKLIFKSRPRQRV
jgi:hypothetical protein